MKKAFFSLLVAFCPFALRAQADKLHVEHDTMYSEFELVSLSTELKNHIINSGTTTVKIRWTRTIVDITPGWATNFCDKNACFLGSVSTRTFDLFPGDTGLLKPIFYAMGIEGCVVYRLDMVSETVGVDYQKSILFLARTTNGCQVLSAGDIEEVTDFAIYPNPSASGFLKIVFADAGFQGTLDICDSQGRTVFQKQNATANEQLNISKLPAGTYLLRVTAADGRTFAVRQFSKI